GIPDIKPLLLLMAWRAGAEMRLPAPQNFLQRKPGRRRHHCERQMLANTKHALAHERAGSGLNLAWEQAAEHDNGRLSIRV
ncbi:MAG: hypothetical protein RBR77_15395, partial [Thauera sp.]|nr:hypothetical protein [Thauera sp.]